MVLVTAPKERIVSPPPVTRRKRRVVSCSLYVGSVILLVCGWMALHGKRFLNLDVTTTTATAIISTNPSSYRRNSSTLSSTKTAIIGVLDDNNGMDFNDSITREMFQRKAESLSQPLQQEMINHQLQSYEIPPQDEAPHVVFDDLKYRRVCSNVHKSVLCMIVRYPFDVPLQDPTVPYPKPVVSHFYNLSRGGLKIIDGSALEGCQQRYPNMTTNNSAIQTKRHRYYACMETISTQFKDIVLALFTRQQRAQTDDDWYGITTHSQYQQNRTRSFFRNHLIVVLGASPTTSVVNCMASIFGKCHFRNRFHYACGGNTRANINHDIAIQVVRYQPNEYKPNTTSSTLLSRHLRHVVNGTPPLLDLLQSPLHNIPQHRYNNVTDETGVTLRPLTVMVEYPIAHMETQDMMSHYPDQVEFNQKKYIQTVMNITSPSARLELRHMGFELQHLIVFDGLPHHFPTTTGAFLEQIFMTKNESSFLQHPYPEWQPDYGSNCRGPIPPNSRLTLDVHLKARHLWQEALLQEKSGQHRWYAPIWEFANQFWWQEVMWSTSMNPRLDCLHGFKKKTGLTCVHKYFLQALIDGYYEEVDDEASNNKVP